MPITTGHDKEVPPKLGGGGPGKISHRRGYGGDDGDHGPPDDFSSSGSRLRRYRIGVAVFSISVTLLFLGIGSGYFVTQGLPGKWDPELRQYVRIWHPLSLPYTQLWINSLLLLASSVTLEFARRGMLTKTEFATMGIRPPQFKAEFPWLGITVALGFGFLAGQLLVWNTLRHQGIYLGGTASGSYFYVLTGLHAVHLTGGLAVLVYALCGEWIGRKFASQQIAVDATGWYWHFMAVLWFGLFALLHFARG